MIQRKIRIMNQQGLTVRSAAQLVEEASKYESSMTILYKGHSVNLQSLLGVLSLGVRYGEEINLIVEGKQEEDHLEKISDYFVHHNLGLYLK